MLKMRANKKFVTASDFLKQFFKIFRLEDVGSISSKT